MENRKTKHTVIYIAPSLPSFVQNDINSLSQKYYVILNRYNWRKKQYLIFYLIHQFFFLFRNIFRVKAIFISFGGLWSLIPSVVAKMFNTPVFIILNGTDCASIPPINYGSLRVKRTKWACKKSYENCSLLLPVSDTLIKTRNTYYSDDKYSYQGVKHFFPNLKTGFQTINNGLDIEYWKKIEEIEKEPRSFVAVFNNKQFVLKGGDLILELAKKLPECSFKIAGATTSAGGESSPPNIEFLGKIKPEELRELYSKCRYHLQLSIFEGFGYALGEAMLCECIPIVSSVNMLPEIAGEAGFVVEKRDINLLMKTIQKAMSIKNSDELGRIARQHIVDNYSLELRKNKLLAIAEKFIDNDF